jgi:hypothetical protein
MWWICCHPALSLPNLYTNQNNPVHLMNACKYYASITKLKKIKEIKWKHRFSFRNTQNLHLALYLVIYLPTRKGQTCDIHVNFINIKKNEYMLVLFLLNFHCVMLQNESIWVHCFHLVLMHLSQIVDFILKMTLRGESILFSLFLSKKESAYLETHL